MRPIRYGIHFSDMGPLPKIIQRVQLAEDLGYDSVWLLDNQLLSPELFAKLAACALGTKRITVAAGVTQTTTRHPTVAASGLAALADLAPGRIAAAFGLGGGSVQSIGLPSAGLTDFRRDFEVIARLLYGESVPYNGREVKLAWANPDHTRQVRLSVQVGLGPRSQRLAGEMGYPVGITADLRRLPRCLEQINAGAAKYGRTAQDLGASWWVGTSVADDWQAIKEHMLPTLARGIASTYQYYRQGSLGAQELPVDLELARQIAEGLRGPVTGAPQAQRLLEYPLEQWRQWLTGYLAGTPQEVLQVLRRGLQHPCIREVVLTLGVPSQRLSVEAIMEAFAKRVRPFVAGD